MSTARVTLLAGGVGAARLVRGLVGVVDPKRLTVIVNTGDDEQFYGLHVSPDLDTVVYTLAGEAARLRGWGLRGESFTTLTALERFYGRAWFRLGDRDLATHIYRSERLRKGWTLSRCTREIARAFGVRSRILPATDDPLRTRIITDDGVLAFQDYLVRRRARPRVIAVRYQGARRARPAPGVVEAIGNADVVVIAPSNPFVSIGPVLAVSDVRRALARVRRRTVAISPLIAGRAVKGPLADMLRSLGFRADTASIAGLYSGLAAKLVVEPGDAPKHGVDGGPAIVEHRILIRRVAAARRLAQFAVETVLAAGRHTTEHSR